MYSVVFYLVYVHLRESKFMKTATAVKVKVADEVWIVTALLHRENPSRAGFAVKEIVARARSEAIHGTLRPGVRQHASQHCVANVLPDPGRYKMLYATAKGTRRLFREGDPFHPDRRDGKVVPRREEIPAKYSDLLDWYWSEYVPRKPGTHTKQSVLSLRGLGKELWAEEDPDSYVQRLREGWA